MRMLLYVYIFHYSVCVWKGEGGRCVAGEGVQGM